MRKILLFAICWLPIATLASESACLFSLKNVSLAASGALTDQGKSPAEFFNDSHHADGSPRLVFLVGVPGAGKSTWAQAADLSAWNILSPDAVRKQTLLEMKAKGQRLGSEEIDNQ